MTTLDTVLTQLFVAKQQLRLIEDASADAKKAALGPAGEFTPESYLSVAADLDMQATDKREEIAELEKARARLTKQ